MGNAAVDASLADVDSAPIAEPLRATLKFLRKVTREHGGVNADDIANLRALGVTKPQIRDALNVCWCFNVITRLADTFCFHVGPQSAFDASARFLLSRGYR
jgi:alkylhydroperoxidase family enzyme